MRSSTLLVLTGVATIVAGAAWYWFSRPAGGAVRTAEILGRTPPVADTTGPIIVAVAGAFLILLGAIVSTRPADRRPTLPTPSLTGQQHPYRQSTTTPRRRTTTTP